MNIGIKGKMVHGKDCSSKFRSKHSPVLVLCLLRNLLEQSLYIVDRNNRISWRARKF